MEITDYGLIELYRYFSENSYCAGWMGEPETEEQLQEEFTEWLARLLDSEFTPYKLSEYEKSAIPTLRKCMEAAKVKAESEAAGW